MMSPTYLKRMARWTVHCLIKKPSHEIHQPLKLTRSPTIADPTGKVNLYKSTRPKKTECYVSITEVHN